MGFPTWTLIGMGVTAVLALLMTVLAYMAQSPRALVRLGLAGQRLDLRVKLFTGYALASLILMLGFFLAGVPLDTGSTTAITTPTSEIANIQPTSADTGAMGDLPPTAVITENSQTTETETTDESSTQTPSSGAFGGPPPSSSDGVATEETQPSATPEQVGPSPTPGDDAGTAVPAPTTNGETNTATPTASPTATNTPLPTATPTPTITPTPIEGITGTINTDGSTLWVRRSPGGQNLVIVQDNEIVLVENGRANQGGILWREIRTVSGIVGWIQAEFLDEG
jgi:cytoskeletal protein RodZ